jgi:hypothetical protein
MSVIFGLSNGTEYSFMTGGCYGYMSLDTFVNFPKNNKLKNPKEWEHPVCVIRNPEDPCWKAMMQTPYFGSAVVKTELFDFKEFMAKHGYNGTSVYSSLRYIENDDNVPLGVVTFDNTLNRDKVKNVIHWSRQTWWPQWEITRMLVKKGVDPKVAIFFGHQFNKMTSSEWSLVLNWNGSLDNEVSQSQVLSWIRQGYNEPIEKSSNSFLAYRKFHPGHDSVNRSMFPGVRKYRFGDWLRDKLHPKEYQLRIKAGEYAVSPRFNDKQVVDAAMELAEIANAKEAA